jgi:hypothetical protein
MITNKIAEIATLNRKKCPESGEFLKGGRGKTALKAAGNQTKVERLNAPGSRRTGRPEGRSAWRICTPNRKWHSTSDHTSGRRNWLRPAPLKDVCLFDARPDCKIKLTRDLGHPTGQPNSHRSIPQNGPVVAAVRSAAGRNAPSDELSGGLGQLTGISRADCQPQAEKDSDGATTRHNTPPPASRRPLASGSNLRIRCSDSPGSRRPSIARSARSATAIGAVSRSRCDATLWRAHAAC